MLAIIIDLHSIKMVAIILDGLVKILIHNIKFSIGASSLSALGSLFFLLCLSLFRLFFFRCFFCVSKLAFSTRRRGGSSCSRRSGRCRGCGGGCSRCGRSCGGGCRGRCSGRRRRCGGSCSRRGSSRCGRGSCCRGCGSGRGCRRSGGRGCCCGCSCWGCCRLGLSACSDDVVFF